MLYRIAGNISGGKTFTIRMSGANVVDAIVQGRKALNEAGVGDDSILQIRVKAIDGKSAVRFGAERERKASKAGAKPSASVSGAKK